MQDCGHPLGNLCMVIEGSDSLRHDWDSCCGTVSSEIFKRFDEHGHCHEQGDRWMAKGRLDIDGLDIGWHVDRWAQHRSVHGHGGVCRDVAQNCD